VTTSFVLPDLTIHRVIEQEGPFLNAFDMFPALTEDMLAPQLDFLAQGRAIDAGNMLQLCFQSYVIRTPHHVVLVDSCIGNDKPRPQRPAWHMKSDDRFAAGLAAAGVTVDDVDFVLCTHMHADHVGWNTRLEDGRWVPTFPKARYLFSETEHAYWSAADAKAPVPAYRDSVLPVIEAGRAEIVGDDHGIGDHIRFLPTPGHTAGHVAIAFGKGRDAAVTPGDLIHSPLQAIHTGLSTKFDVDPAGAARTRQAFLERYVDTDTLCCMAHFPSPSVGRIRRRGEGFQCVAAD
jgi:glyoxylase-like metal-dependent hydrolase (beta-lactamase superfamily II)